VLLDSNDPRLGEDGDVCPDGATCKYGCDGFNQRTQQWILWLQFVLTGEQPRTHTLLARTHALTHARARARTRARTHARAHRNEHCAGGPVLGCEPVLSAT